MDEKGSGGQTFHLDNASPMLWDKERGWWGVFSVVLQLTDGPFVEIGEFLSQDVWNEKEPHAKVHKKVLEELARDHKQKSIRGGKYKMAPAASLAVFPAGTFFLVVFFFCLFVWLQHLL
jgi:hypothetical protein